MQSASVMVGPITGTTDSFQWGGGLTSFNVAGDFAASLEVALQQLGPDNTTWLDINVKTAAGHSNHQLAPGLYRIELAAGTSTGIYVELARVPA